jgi:hypothetical protein
LLIVIVLVAITWLLASESTAEKIVVPLSVGLVTSYIVAVMASFPPIMTIPLGENEAIRTFSPVAYPFCLQQYRDYDTNLFSYSVNVGWPEGFHLLELGLQEDQSHLIRAAHYFSGLFLGLVLLVFVVTLVGILTLAERKRMIIRKQRMYSAQILITVQLILLILMFNLYLTGNIVYPLGGAVVLLITLYPAYRVFRNKVP